jgi:hypothetical protein
VNERVHSWSLGATGKSKRMSLDKANRLSVYSSYMYRIHRIFVTRTTSTQALKSLRPLFLSPRRIQNTFGFCVRRHRFSFSTTGLERDPRVRDIVLMHQSRDLAVVPTSHGLRCLFSFTFLPRDIRITSVSWRLISSLLLYSNAVRNRWSVGRRTCGCDCHCLAVSVSYPWRISRRDRWHSRKRVTARCRV